MSQHSEFEVKLHRTAVALLNEMFESGSKKWKPFCRIEEFINLFQLTCREYLKKPLHNEEEECRSAQSSLDLKDAAQTQLSFTLRCGCSTDYPCSCNKKSQLEFWCTLLDDSEEFEYDENPIQLQLQVNSEHRVCVISYDA